MQELSFTTKLAEQKVSITDTEGVQKEYTLRELTGDQRQVYMDSFDFDITLVDGKAQISSKANIKSFPTKTFLSLCLFDEDNNPVTEKVIGKYPSTTTEGLHKAALKLSALDKKSIEDTANDFDEAKNDSEVKSDSGIE